MIQQKDKQIKKQPTCKQIFAWRSIFELQKLQHFGFLIKVIYDSDVTEEIKNCCCFWFFVSFFPIMLKWNMQARLRELGDLIISVEYFEKAIYCMGNCNPVLFLVCSNSISYYIWKTVSIINLKNADMENSYSL